MIRPGERAAEASGDGTGTGQDARVRHTGAHVISGVIFAEYCVLLRGHFGMSGEKKMGHLGPRTNKSHS